MFPGFWIKVSILMGYVFRAVISNQPTRYISKDGKDKKWKLDIKTKKYTLLDDPNKTKPKSPSELSKKLDYMYEPEGTGVNIKGQTGPGPKYEVDKDGNIKLDTISSGNKITRRIPTKKLQATYEICNKEDKKHEEDEDEEEDDESIYGIKNDESALTDDAPLQEAVYKTYQNWLFTHVTSKIFKL